MRRILLVAAGLFVSAMLAPQASQAGGNVLLPSTTGSSTTSTPNLGLVAPSTNDAPLSSPPVANAPSTPASPQPAASMKMSDLITSPVSAEAAARLPPGTIPTTIIHQPDMTSVPSQPDKDLPYGLTISIGGKSIFGSQDVQKIGNKLGLNRTDIPSSCILTMQGMIRTDKGSYLITGTTSQYAVVRYAGTIKNYIMAAEAMCTAGTLPQGSGFLTETGGRYSIPLQQIKCTPPNRQVTSLTITYNGSDTSQCAYE